MMTPTATPTKWLFSHKVWHDKTLGPAAIGVAHGVITDLITDADAIKTCRAEATSRNEAWHDLGDRLVTPAMVNAHTHLAMACFRGLSIEDATGGNVVEDLFFAVEAAMTSADIAAFARIGAYESLLAGVGLVWEHYYGGEALADAISQTSLCAVVAPTLQDLDGPGKDRWEENLELTLKLADPAWQARGIYSALGPHATDTVSATLWERVRHLANTHELPVHAHVAQSIEEYERAAERHGTSPVGWLDTLGLLDEDGGAPSFLMVHAIFMSDADLATLDPARHALGFCPYSQLIFGFPADVTRWEAHGLPWYVATDAAASNDSMNLQKEMRHIAGLRTVEASSHPDYRRFASSGALEDARNANNARQDTHRQREALATDEALLSRVFSIPGALHPSFRAGTIAPGALANLIVWDTAHPSMWPGLHPLRTIAMGDTTDAIWNMMARGEWVSEGGNYHRALTTSPDYLDAHQEATARLTALLARL